LTGNKNWGFLNTLAAALADAGRWDEAVQLQQKIVTATGEDSGEFREHLDLFLNRKPCRREYADL
jgi:hypothetical protein